MSAHRRARRRRAGRTLRLVLALALVALTAIVGAGSIGSSATASSADTSPLTRSGTGPFSGLKVTVEQTRDLINQTTVVSWTGGKPTVPASGSNFGTDYVQLMQCWGDAADGPTREQCEFGARYTEAAGAQATTRQLNSATYTDPLESFGKPVCGEIVYAPFHAVNGKQFDCGSNEYFDASTSNEIPLARTRSDGTGKEYFEIQTAREAPGLGCGTVIPSTGKPRACWLVAVPRGLEVDGTQKSGIGSNRLDSSPLSASNWRYRIAIPLQFQPVGSRCALGTLAETPMAGHELATEATSRWLPKLCTSTTVVGFSQVSADTARRQIVSKDPELAFMSIPPTDVPSDVKPVYAPVTVSGVTIAFNVARRYDAEAPEDVLRKDGQRFPQLNLTPRLVAKLLSQSYRTGVDLQATYLKDNPVDLITDPDFLAHNPEFKKYLATSMYIPDIITPFGQSDAAQVLWRWVNADKSARAFLDGKADPWGAKVNPKYKKIALPIDDFPKNDLYCATYTTRLPLCTLDAHPYTTDMHEAARSIARGDGLRKIDWVEAPAPGIYKKQAPFPAGETALLTVTDTATAERYGLPTARLINGSGKFVAPTTSSMLAGVKSMKTGSTPGVLDPNPAAKGASVYPLTLVTYAGTNPAALSKQDRARYATVLRYAADKGQVLGLETGELPYGYAPMSETLRKQTRAAATSLENWKPTPAGSDASANPGATGPAGSGATPPVPPAAIGAVTTDPTVLAATATRNPIVLSASSGATPWFGVGATKYVVLVVLVIGILAAAAGPVLLRLARSPRG